MSDQVSRWRCPGPPPRRVFLSHTRELREHPAGRSFVGAAEDAVIRAGHAVVDMAYFAARDSEPSESCTSMVARAGVYVGIIGFRYGAAVPGRAAMSYTELEFEAATRLGLQRLILLLRDGAPFAPPALQPAEDADRQREFRKRLLRDAGLTVAWVGSPAETELALFHALVELAPRIAHISPRARSAATGPRARERRWCGSRRAAGPPGPA
jgi:hypothetical protein